MSTTTRVRDRRRGGARFGMLGLLSLLVAFAAPTTAHATEGRVELAVRPVGQAGQYFDLTLRPGETRTLEVELANVGGAALAARTYAADVYTIINGGFGARLRDEPKGGTTLWLDYTTDVLQLPAGQGIRRTFAIAVPTDAAPGEYITSVVLENDEAIRGGGDVAIDQVVRQAIAVVVTVPGSREPGLAVARTSHKVVAGRSVVAVAVENTGNVRLKPVAELVLIDSAGAEVNRARVPMDTFYAHTETLVEVPLAALLQPGSYRVRLTVQDDAEDVRARAAAIQLVVEAPPAEPAVGDGVVPALTEVIQGVREGLVPLPAGLTLLAASLALGIVIGSVLLVVRRRRGSGRDPQGGEARR